ncbi:P2Y purinoceptor 1-like [Protopterus annectens]|uniref:P2Y purinoceptor 1-like n=1 Tax=Protopterus annectens TaxID=7888 RepID=UPI001CF9A1C9|nr:P2Y purinoceptor 1-like [Protopterus annectens]
MVVFLVNDHEPQLMQGGFQSSECKAEAWDRLPREVTSVTGILYTELIQSKGVTPWRFLKYFRRTSEAAEIIKDRGPYVHYLERTLHDCGVLLMETWQLNISRNDTSGLEFTTYVTVSPSIFSDIANGSTFHGFPYECLYTSYLIVLPTWIILLVLGLPPNVIALWVFIKQKAWNSSMSIFLLNLAIKDVLFCLLTPLQIASTFVNNTTLQEAVFDIVIANMIAGIIFLTCVCVERYIAVVHPLKSLQLASVKNRIIASVVIWTIVVFSAMPIPYGKYPKLLFIFLLIFLIALVTILFCSISVVVNLLRVSPGGQEIHPMKKRAMRSVLISLIVSLASFGPFFSYVMMFTIAENLNLLDSSYCRYFNVSLCLVSLSSVLDPIVYVLMGEKFNFRSLCCCCKEESQSPQQ